MGDTVIIRKTPDIAISDYTVGKGIKYENPSSSKVELNINKGKYFGFECNDIIKHQADFNLMENWSNDASEQMKVAVDTDFLANIYTDVASTNQGTAAGRISQNINVGSSAAPLQLTANNITDFILDMGLILDEQNLPETGRWIVLPHWACRLLKGSELKQAYLTGDGVSPLRNGKIGMVDRFTVYSSNSVASLPENSQNSFQIVAGHKAGLTFAAQMTEMETLKNPNDFGDLVRGLNVYGYKVTEGRYLAHARVYR